MPLECHGAIETCCDVRLSPQAMIDTHERSHARRVRL
jgi:hypothetical protein